MSKIADLKAENERLQQELASAEKRAESAENTMARMYDVLDILRMRSHQLNTAMSNPPNIPGIDSQVSKLIQELDQVFVEHIASYTALTESLLAKAFEAKSKKELLEFAEAQILKYQTPPDGTLH
jgi:hypothetical protein